MIDRYLTTLLKPRLRVHNTPDDTVAAITADVHDRLCSALCHWADPLFRETLLTPVREEAVFYRPTSATLEVRSLVVLGIRNSLIEDWHSGHFGRTVPLSDAAMRDLTRTAIRYFADQPASAFTCATVAPDVFGDLPTKYPAAWQALSQLAALADGETSRRFQPVKPVAGVLNSLGADVAGSIQPGYRWAILSGMSEVIDPALADSLRAVAQAERAMFFTPCFKMISRNLDKLLKVIEVVLASGWPLVTVNYYLNSGLVQRRQQLWPPPHSTGEVQTRLADPRLLSGVAPEHRAMLRGLQEA